MKLWVRQKTTHAREKQERCCFGWMDGLFEEWMFQRHCEIPFCLGFGITLWWVVRDKGTLVTATGCGSTMQAATLFFDECESAALDSSELCAAKRWSVIVLSRFTCLTAGALVSCAVSYL